MSPPHSQPAAPARTVPPLPSEESIETLLAWSAAGLKTALVTLVGIDGTTPRPLGAQMAVAEDGRFSGYLSGGCFEPSVAKEAQRAIGERQNRLVRYGKGSRYLDLKLPCESGLDIYFDQGLDPDILAKAQRLRNSRQPFVLATDLISGLSRIELPEISCQTPLASRSGDLFRRTYRPSTRVLLAGGGPALTAIARLLAVTGFDLSILTPEDSIRAELTTAGLPAAPLTDVTRVDITFADTWTAIIVAFHEHEWESPLLARLLQTPSFYIGVMGSRRAHEKRLAQLTAMGCSAEDLRRLRSPIGLISNAKSQTSLAAGVLAEVVQEAKSAGLLP